MKCRILTALLLMSAACASLAQAIPATPRPTRTAAPAQTSSLPQTVSPAQPANPPDTTSSARTQNAPTLNETAHFLAGMPVTGALEPLTHTPGWQEHAQAMNEAWNKKEQLQISPIRQWMQANAPQFHRSTDTAFYMFSGPDFLY